MLIVTHTYTDTTRHSILWTLSELHYVNVFAVSFYLMFAPIIMTVDLVFLQFSFNCLTHFMTTQQKQNGKFERQLIHVILKATATVTKLTPWST